MRKLEELLDLPPVESFDTEDQPSSADAVSDTTDAQPLTLVSVEEKINHALSAVTDLDRHDGEMDEIAQRALESYEELREYGLNSSDAHAARILEVAGQMLKTALEARNSKNERRLKTIDLQLKALRAQQATEKQPDRSGGEFDRNQLLRMLAQEQPGSSDQS